MTPQPNPAGRTRRNVDELRALARDCGWHVSVFAGDTTLYRHRDLPDEEIDIPDYGAERFAERYDAALARLTTEPAAGEPDSDVATLTEGVMHACASIARSMCHWVRGVGDARDESHEAFHFGNVCPYEAVAAVLSGQPDPRDTAPTAAPVEEPQARAFLQCTYPPSMTLIASGRESFCTDALERWLSEHPLPQYTRAYVVTVAAETICEPGVGVYTVPTAQDGQR